MRGYNGQYCATGLAGASETVAYGGRLILTSQCLVLGESDLSMVNEWAKLMGYPLRFLTGGMGRRTLRRKMWSWMNSNTEF